MYLMNKCDNTVWSLTGIWWQNNTFTKPANQLATRQNIPDSKVRGTNMRPTWVLSAPDGPMLATWTLLSGIWWWISVLCPLCTTHTQYSQPRTLLHGGCPDMNGKPHSDMPNHSVTRLFWENACYTHLWKILLQLIDTHWGWDKMVGIFQRHFQMNFSVSKCFSFNQNLTGILSQ